MLRIFELVVPVQIKSFSVESFDKILSFKLFQGTGTWICKLVNFIEYELDFRIICCSVVRVNLDNQ